MDPDRLKGTGRELGGKLESGFGRLTGDSETEAKGTVQDLAGQAQQAFGQVKDSARDLAGNLTDRAQDAYSQGSDYARQGVQSVHGSVKENPLGSLAIAAGVGYLLAYLIHRR